jgi:hypothetical protein
MAAQSSGNTTPKRSPQQRPPLTALELPVTLGQSLVPRLETWINHGWCGSLEWYDHHQRGGEHSALLLSSLRNYQRGRSRYRAGVEKTNEYSWLPRCLSTSPLSCLPHRGNMGARRYLPGTLNGVRVDAIPDTGSTRNVISMDFAVANRFFVLRGPAAHIRIFQFASQGSGRSAGRCLLGWEFANEPHRTYKVWFEVLEGLVHNVVIGNPLLRETETMSTHSHRLRRRKSSCCLTNGFFVNSIGSPQQRLIGTLNGCQVSMLPDTGSERNIISEACARIRGLSVHSEPENRIWLIFADGSLRQTVGQVEAYLGFDDNPFHDFPVTFDVLPECAHDVIIGDDILDGKEVYSRHVDCLEDIWSGFDYDEFNLVRLAIFRGCFASKDVIAREGVFSHRVLGSQNC